MDALPGPRPRTEAGPRGVWPPAVIPAAAAFIGALAAHHATWLPWPLLLLLVGLGVAYGRRAGLAVACLGLGLVSALIHGATAGDLEAAGLDPQRPVTAQVRPVGPWREGELGWSSAVRVEVLAQGTGSDLRLYRPPGRIRLQLPSAAQVPPSGQLRLRGYLRRGAALHNAPPGQPGPWRLWVKSKRLLEEISPPEPLIALSNSIRERVSKALDGADADAGSGDGAAFARALVLGDPSRLAPEVVRALRRLGLGHLLAVSGLHVAAVAGLTLLLLAWWPRRPRMVLALLPVALYLLLVGPRPSLLRAAVMALGAVLALSSRRPPMAANALGCFVLATILITPALAVDVGFQLTVAATAGLVLLAPVLERRWRPLPVILARPVAATLSAQLATLPFALPVFHLWVPAAPLFNLLLVPWAGVVLAACLGWTVAAVAMPSLAAAAVPALDLVCRPLVLLREVPPGPWAAWPWSGGGGGAMLLVLVLAAAAWWPRRLGVALALALCLVALRPPPTVPQPRLVVLDVGQGEALLLQDGRSSVLVDGGGWFNGGLGERVLLPALAGLGVRRLDAVVLTHPDRDHCGGLVEIADYLPVGELWSDPRWWQEGCGAELARRLPPRSLATGDRHRVGRWRLQVLASGEGSRDNDRSLVLRASVGERCALLTGDIEGGTEAWLLRGDRRLLACDILKVGHHGSKTSTGASFLAAVAPRRALVSAGQGNRYGHPSPVVVERLHHRRIQVLRTDLHGQLRLTLRPAGGLWIETLASPTQRGPGPDG